MRLLILSQLWVILFLYLAPAIRAAVLAIDYGAEFTKLSLVKPGVAFDVLLDRDSKRKIQSVVGWKRDDRVFGAEGKMAATRFPDAHFPYIKPLIGNENVPPLSIYPSPPSLTPEGAIVFPHPKIPDHISPAPSSLEQVWIPTALLAHQISYFRSLAASLTSPGQTMETVNQAVVTVPAWWNQYQRKAYKDALELQGLTCLAMIGEGTGVALNYAMTRSFPEIDPASGPGDKEYHVIYDSGAMTTTATVVAFYQTSELPTPKSKTPVTTTHIEVIGTAYEPVGGILLDLTLQETLLADFVQKTGKEGIREDPRAMAKVIREATRVKHILSANQESNINIESLYDDVDYRSRLSRTKLEETLADSSKLFASPLLEALSNAGMDMPNITSIILFGGNTRVPFVQSALKSVLSDEDADKIAQNVNTDEAAVLGAAFYGAALSKVFKMKKIDVTETSFEDFRMDGEVLFPAGSVLGEKKTITLPTNGLTSFDFSQDSRPVLHLDIVDLPEALASFTSPEPVINLTVRLDARGYLATSNVVLVSNVTEPASGGVAGAFKGLFGGKKDKDKVTDADDVEVEDSDETVIEAEEKAESENATDAAATGKVKKDKKAKKAAPERVALKFREKALGIKPMTGEEKRTTMARLTSIAAYEEAKTAREEARNLLEGYLYRLSSSLSQDAENRVILDYSTTAEQKALSALKDETFEWLSLHAEKAEEKVLQAKRSGLQVLEYPINFRFTESQTRAKAVDDFVQVMHSGRDFLVKARESNTLALEAAESATPEKPVAPPKYTEEELTDLDELLTENQVWMDTRMEKQVKIEDDKTKDPEILTSDLNSRGKKLQMTVLRLESKKAPRAPRPKTSTSTSASSSKTAATSSATADPIPTEEAEPTEWADSETPTASTSAPASEKVPPVHEEL